MLIWEKLCNTFSRSTVLKQIANQMKTYLRYHKIGIDASKTLLTKFSKMFSFFCVTWPERKESPFRVAFVQRYVCKLWYHKQMEK